MIKIHSLSEVTAHLKGRTHLFLDLDDTIICPKYFQHDPNLWFRNTFPLFDFRTHSKHRTFHSFCNKNYLYLVKEFNRQVENTEWALTEPFNIHELLLKWHRLVVGMYGLTARGKELSKITNKTLVDLGIYFSTRKTILASRLGMTHTFDSIENLRSLRGKFDYSSRIFYCGGNDKSDVFRKLTFFDRVVCVDDSIVNLEFLEKACKEKNIKFIGLHYVQK